MVQSWFSKVQVCRVLPGDCHLVAGDGVSEPLTRPRLSQNAVLCSWFLRPDTKNRQPPQLGQKPARSTGWFGSGPQPHKPSLLTLPQICKVCILTAGSHRKLMGSLVLLAPEVSHRDQRLLMTPALSFPAGTKLHCLYPTESHERMVGFLAVPTPLRPGQGGGRVLGGCLTCMGGCAPGPSCHSTCWGAAPAPLILSSMLSVRLCSVPPVPCHLSLSCC